LPGLGRSGFPDTMITLGTVDQFAYDSRELPESAWAGAISLVILRLALCRFAPSCHAQDDSIEMVSVVSLTALVGEIEKWRRSSVIWRLTGETVFAYNSFLF
jgi:hypothetical protein